MSGPHSAVLPDTTYVTIPAAAGLTADDALDWHIDLDVFEQAVAHTNWDTITAATGALLNGTKDSSGAQNAELNFDAPLARGTWTVEVMYRANSDAGIITIQFGGVSKGTIDTYAGSSSYNNRASVSSIAVTTTGVVRVKLIMATKNASSSSYYGRIQHIQLRRTA